MRTTLAFQRLLWKDLRVLRSLWLLCGLGVTALMLLILVIAESNDHSQGFSYGFWILTIWVPPVYVLAATAAMYAGEREEGTLTWLTTLAPRLTTLLGSRSLLLLGSGILLQVWYGAAATLLSQFDEMQTSNLGEDLYVMTFVILEAMVFGMFWSLQTPRPLNAILYAAITIVLVNTGSIALISELGGNFSLRADTVSLRLFGFWGWMRCMILVAVCTANWGLAEQWLNGRPWDWDWLVERFRQLRLPRLANVQRISRAISANEVADPWRRAWQRLRWLEWQAVKSYAWIVAAMGLVATISLLASHRPHPGFAIMFSWMALGLAGLSAWYGEQSRNNFRALVRLGVSPAELWANKLLQWGLAAVVSVLAIFAVTMVTALIMGEVLLSARFEDWYEQSVHGLFVQPESGILWALIHGFTLYAIAFTSAHLFRKTIIALGVTLIGSVVLSIWFFLAYELRFPIWLFLLPIPVWLLWVSWSALPAWWIEQTSWQMSRRQIGGMILRCGFPILMIGLAMGYRVWEIPRIPDEIISAEMMPQQSLNADGRPEAAAVQKQWAEILASLQYPVTDPDFSQFARPAEEGAALEPIDAGTAMGGVGMSAMEGGAAGGPFDALAHAQIRKLYFELNHTHLITLRNQLLNADRLSMEVAPSRGRRNPFYGLLLLYAAQENLQAGDVEVSLDYLKAGVRLGGCLQRFVPLEQQVAQQRELRLGELFDEMIRWAQLPQQTEASLRRGLEICTSEMRYWQVQPEEILQQQEYELQRADFTYWFWERARERQLTKMMFFNRLWYFRRCQMNDTQPGVLAAEKSDLFSHLATTSNLQDPRLRAWHYRPVEYDRYRLSYGTPFSAEIVGLDPTTIESLHRMENRYHATLAVMAVVGHRRLTGNLPASLHDVEKYVPKIQLPNFGTISPICDVWTQAMFHYVPTGFHTDSVPTGSNSDRSDMEIEAIYRRPLLWSGGPGHLQMFVHGNSVQRFSTGNSRFTIYDTKGYMENWLFPIPPQDPVAEPAAN